MRKMRWECEKDGCFNVKKRLKLGVFDECFPRGAGFGDVDAIIEIGGSFLMQEWKDPCCLPNGWERENRYGIKGGQKYMFDRMCKDEKWTVVVVYGDAETMDITAIEIFSRGKHNTIRKCDFETLKLKCKSWSDRVDGL